MAGLKRYPDGRGGFVRLSDREARAQGYNPENGTADRASSPAPVPTEETYEGPLAPGAVVEGAPKGALPPSGPTHRARAAAEAEAIAEKARADLTAELEALAELTPEELAELTGTPAPTTEEAPPVPETPETPEPPAPDAPATPAEPADKARPAPSAGRRRRGSASS